MAFSSPFVDCRVSNPKTGSVFSLGLFGGDEQLPYVQEVRLNMARNVDLGMSIILNPPYEEALRIISKDSEVIRLGNTLAVRWGYADMDGYISDWIYGFMGQPQVSFGEEIVVSAEATGLNWHMDRVSRSRVWGSQESPRTILDITIEIAERYGLEVVNAAQVDVVRALLTVSRNSVAQGGRTDMRFLMSEIEKCGARMILQNNKLFIIDASAPLPDFPSVNATFGYHSELDFTNNILPMSSFSSESMGHLFIKDFNGITSTMFGPNSDPDQTQMRLLTKDELNSIEGSFSSNFTHGSDDDGNEAVDMGDVKTKASVAVEKEGGEGGKFYTPPLDGSESEEFFENQIAAIYSDVSSENGLNIKFSSGIAIPNLLPGMYVGIVGVGDFFSTTYMINELSLTISGDGTNMDLECFSRGFPAVSPDLDPLSRPVSKKIDVPSGSVEELSLVSKVGI